MKISVNLVQTIRNQYAGAFRQGAMDCLLSKRICPYSLKQPVLWWAWHAGYDKSIADRRAKIRSSLYGR